MASELSAKLQKATLQITNVYQALLKAPQGQQILKSHRGL